MVNVLNHNRMVVPCQAHYTGDGTRLAAARLPAPSGRLASPGGSCSAVSPGGWLGGSLVPRWSGAFCGAPPVCAPPPSSQLRAAAVAGLAGVVRCGAWAPFFAASRPPMQIHKICVLLSSGISKQRFCGLGFGRPLVRWCSAVSAAGQLRRLACSGCAAERGQ